MNPPGGHYSQWKLEALFLDFDDEAANYLREENIPRDPKVDQAIDRLRRFFDASPQRVFYSTQIETSFRA